LGLKIGLEVLSVHLFCLFADLVEVYLLPKLIAGLAVKRYPSRPLVQKLVGRVKIYFRTILGY